jgi:Tol biopolymer transport system component
MNSIIRLGLWSMVALLLLVVLPAAGTLADDESNNPAISADGRYVAYDSLATNLVAGDTNAVSDIFVRDRQTGTTTLASKDSAGVEGTDQSFNPSISGDGRYVAFYSDAANLVTGDSNGRGDIFVRDRQTGTTTLVSRNSGGNEGSGGDSDNPSISADGRYVAFDSYATNLVSGDTNGKYDIFVRDRQTGTTYLISKDSAGVPGDDGSSAPSMSSDGRYVAFDSYATTLVPGDTNGKKDIFVRDRQTGTTYLVSKSSAGVEGDDSSESPTISSDGRYVTFESAATNLVAGDTNAKTDIFVRDRQTGSTYLVSRSSAGEQGNDASYHASISADGRYVAFWSPATNLVSGDTNGMYDIFVRDRQTGTTTLVSKDSSGVLGNIASFDPSISGDGRYVAFISVATNLVPGDTNGVKDIFVRDRQTGTTTLVSKS